MIHPDRALAASRALLLCFKTRTCTGVRRKLLVRQAPWRAAEATFSWSALTRGKHDPPQVVRQEYVRDEGPSRPRVVPES